MMVSRSTMHSCAAVDRASACPRVPNPSKSRVPAARRGHVTSAASRRELLLSVLAGTVLQEYLISKAPARADGGPAPLPASGSTDSTSTASPAAARPSGAASDSIAQPSSSPAPASPEAPSAPPAPAPAAPPTVTVVPKDSITLSEEAAKKLLEEEDERRKQRKRKKGRIRELEEIRSELAEKELILLQKEQELLERDQTLIVLKEELDLERKLRALLTKEKEKAEEEAALSMGLCTGGAMLP